MSRERRVFPRIEPVFVVGAGRSGTTLLRAMLHAHPGLAIMGELQYFSEILQLRREIPSLREDASFDAFLRRVRRTPHFDLLVDGESLFREMEGRLRNRSDRSYELVYRTLLECYARRHGKRRPGEKSGVNVRYLDELFAIFPNAKAVSIVRDPRAVLASVLRVPFYSDEVVTNAVKWRLDVAAGRRFERENPDRIREIRYEDLVLEPARTLRGICAFLEEPFAPEMLEFHRGGERLVTEREPWKKGIGRPLSREGLTRWEGELRPGEILFIDRITGPVRRALGYPDRPQGWRGWREAPIVLAKALLRYVPYAVAQARDRREAGGAGEAKRLYRMLMEAIGLSRRG